MNITKYALLLYWDFKKTCYFSFGYVLLKISINNIQPALPQKPAPRPKPTVTVKPRVNIVKCP